MYPGDGIAVDAENNIYLPCFNGWSGNIPCSATPNAFQSACGGGSDQIILVLAADFTHPLYASYYGGPANESVLDLALDRAGNVVIVGAADGPGYPLLNSCQGTFGGTTIPHYWACGDWTIVKFRNQGHVPPSSPGTVSPVRR